MNEIIYLEPDEEITSVIDKLKASESNSVALVIPRGATLAQSIVNLKLLKKAAEGIEKEISLVASDKIATNLASQLGIAIYSKVSDAQKAVSPKKAPAASTLPDHDISFKINDYSAKASGSVDEDEAIPMSDEELGEENQYKEAISEALKEKDETDEMPEIEEKSQEENEEDEEPEKKFESKPISEKESTIKEKTDNPDKEIGFSRKPFIVIAIISIVLILAASYLFLPYATAKVILKTDDYKFEDNITIGKDVAEISAKEMLIPGKIVEIEKEQSKSFDATGKKDVGEKATGKLTVYNDYDDKPQLLPVGTKLSSGGKVFLSTKEVSVPGFTFTILPGPKLVTNPGTVEVTVEAEKSGDQYNLAPSNFTITALPADKQSKIYGRSTTAFTGGVTKEVKVVTEEDLANAEKQLKEEILTNSKKELLQVAENQHAAVIESSITEDIVLSSASKEVNSENDKFDYTLKLHLSTLGFSQQDLFSAVRQAVELELENKMLINPEKSEVTYQLKESNAGNMVLAIVLNGKVATKLDEEALKNKIKNKNLLQAKSSLIGDAVISDVAISIWPNIIKRTPVLTKRIDINFDYSK